MTGRWLAGALIVMVASARAEIRDEGPKLDGKKHGTWREYDGEGRLLWERQFLFGERHGDTVQYGEGCDAKKGQRVVVARTSYVMGNKDGEHTWFHCDGQVNVSGAFVGGREHGTWTWTRRNGTKIREGEYVCGRAFGPWSEWDDKGTLKKTETKELPAAFTCPDPAAAFDDAVHDAWLASACDGPVQSEQLPNACSGLDTCKRKAKVAKKAPRWCTGFKHDGFERWRCYTRAPEVKTWPRVERRSPNTGTTPTAIPPAKGASRRPPANRCGGGGVRG